MHRHIALGLLAVAAASSLASAGLTQSQTFTGAPVVFNNGAGSGFGGQLGNGGSLSFNVVGANLAVTYTPSSTTDGNIVAVWLDTRSGGFTDAQLDDRGDGSRTALTQPINGFGDNSPTASANSNLNFPGLGATADNRILPEYGLTFGNFGAVSFELTSGSLNFLTFNGAGAGVSRTVEVSLASLGNPSIINFFSALVSDSGYASNESLPGGSLQDTGNPGFGDERFGGAPAPQGGFGINNFNQVVIPEPAALGLLAMPALALVRRRK